MTNEYERIDKNRSTKSIGRRVAGKIVWKYSSLWVRPTNETGEVSFSNFFRGLTGWLRVLPDFLILGIQKGGTTSLYNYLLAHPSIHVTHTKEIRYFDRNYDRGENWYRANFPTVFSKFISKRKGTPFIVGDASPDYLFHNIVPKKVKKDFPDIKLIVVLRNPVDRAYSHYNMRKRGGQETLSFEEAIKIHDSRIQKSWWDHHRFSYLKRGLYAEQLQHWFKFFPRKQFFILETNQMEANPLQFYDNLCNFLEIERFQIDFTRYNVGKYSQMNPETRKYLIKYFKPHNEKLYELLERKFDWDN